MDEIFLHCLRMLDEAETLNFHLYHAFINLIQALCNDGSTAHAPLDLAAQLQRIGRIARRRVSSQS